MNFAQKKALIVDDEVDLAKVLSVAVKQINMTSDVVHTIDDAIKSVDSNKYDIIISDVYLPHKTGKDLFDHVIKSGISTPFMFMTGNPDVQMAVNFLQKGGYDYIIKPFHINDFLTKVTQVLEKYQKNVQKELYVQHLRNVIQMRMQELKIYKDIYQSLNDIILVTDTSGKIVTANKAIKELSGYEVEEVIEKHPSILLDPDKGLEIEKEIMAKLVESGRWEGDLESVNNDGKKWNALINAISIKDENDDTFAYGWQFKDITLLRKTQAQMLEYFDHMTQAQEAIIFGLAKLAEYRDMETGYHLERMRAYAKLLAEKLQTEPGYAFVVNEEYVNDIYKTAPLHDIGKVGISDSILKKEGSLTRNEFEIIKSHTTIGYQTLKSIESQYGYMGFLQMGLDITKYHHEKWDGSGYPSGLRGEEIPLSARIVAIADVYDALTSRRVYKPEFSHNKSMNDMKKVSGIHFDPDLFEIFEEHADEFNEIRENYRQLEENIEEKADRSV